MRLPAGYRLVLGVNGSPLMQMSVFGPDGDLLEAKGPLRVVSLGVQKRSPVQLLVTNEGVAPALITLSLRADPPAPAGPTARRPRALSSGAAGPAGEAPAPDRAGPRPACRRPASPGATANQLIQSGW